MIPFGIFSTPNTSAHSYCPARIAPAASCSAAPPLAQPASTSTIGMPVRASAPSTLCPEATPPYAVPQNAASNVGSPASLSAARTACTPIPVFDTPSNRPNGWIPTPAISTRVLMREPSCSRLERPGHDRFTVFTEKRFRHELQRLTERELRGLRFGQPGDHAQVLAFELDDTEAERYRP